MSSIRRTPQFLLFLLAPVVLGAAADQPATSPDKPAPAASPAPAADGTLTFPSQLELVTVDAVVVDKKNGAITDLTKDDFVILEDNEPQTIASFEAIQVPPAPAAVTPEAPKVSTNITHENVTGRSFIVVFDDVHMTRFQGRRAKTAIAEFLQKGVREGDRVTLISSGGDAWWTSRMESGRDELTAVLKRLDGRLIPYTGNDKMSDYEAMRIHVYNDTQVMGQVSRRFDTYGVTHNDMTGGTANGGASMAGDPNGDPMVSARASEVYFQSVSRNRITLDVIERILASLRATKGRKSLLLVSQGFIYDANLDEFKRVVQESRRANCAIYFVDTRGLGGMPDYFSAEFGPALDPGDYGSMMMDQQLEAEGSESIAADTGGFSVSNTNDLGKGIQRITDESRAYYLLGYHSTNTKADGRFRKIQVKVNRKNLTVRARKGYFAPLEGGKNPLDDKKKGTADPELQRAVDSPFDMDQIPLRMTAYVLDETLLGKAQVMIAADADVSNFGFEQKNGRFADTLEFLLVAAHRETGEFFRIDQKVDMNLLPATRERVTKSWFPILREFELAPGAYQAKIVVRDKRTGRIGTLTHPFEVPDLTQFRISTPVISDTLAPVPEGVKDTSPHPAVLARRVFAPESRLFCSFEVYGATKDKASGMPAVSSGYVIKRSDGTPVTTVDPTTIRPTSLGKLSRLTGTQLAGVPPGRYELVLTVKDELAGKSLEIKEPFTIEGTAAASAAGGE